MTAAPGPHRIFVERPVWCAALILISLLLSLWAVHADPVINGDGTNEVRAAQSLSNGEWHAGLNTARRPVYSVLAAVISRLTGMSVGHSAYALNAVLFAVLVLGYVALAETLGARTPGGRLLHWLAAFVVLLFPALNRFRSFITADVGYWAFYVWSLAWFMSYAAAPRRLSLWMWALAGLAALLFGLQALVYLCIVPLWWWAREAGTGGRARVLKALVVLGGIVLIVGYALWQQAWESGAPAGELLRHPAQHFSHASQQAEQALRFKLEGLRRLFLDRFSRHYDAVALLTTVVILSGVAVVRALGLLYAALTGYAWMTSKRMLPAATRYWWGAFVTLSLVLLLVPAMTRFEVSARNAMTAALSVLAIVPLALERLRRLGMQGQGKRRWLLPIALGLVLASGVAGLDLHANRLEWREAGLWLRATAAPGSSLYSNSRVVVYYSGLDGYRPGSGYTWQEAMRTVWSGHWRKYDYLAVVIPHSRAYRRRILMRDIRTRPVKVFTSPAGDRVLIFRPRH